MPDACFVYSRLIRGAKKSQTSYEYEVQKVIKTKTNAKLGDQNLTK